MRYASSGTPLLPQLRGRLGEAVACLVAGDDAVGAKVAEVALMTVIMRRHPDRPMTLAVGPVSCLQLVALAWVMGAQLDVSGRELVLLAEFGVVHAAATVLLAEGVLRIRAAKAAFLGALERCRTFGDLVGLSAIVSTGGKFSCRRSTWM